MNKEVRTLDSVKFRAHLLWHLVLNGRQEGAALAAIYQGRVSEVFTFNWWSPSGELFLPFQLPARKAASDEFTLISSFDKFLIYFIYQEWARKFRI